jgi:hypothetical protein
LKIQDKKRNTCKERYGNEKYINIEKRKKTNGDSLA